MAETLILGVLSYYKFYYIRVRDFKNLSNGTI